MLAISSREDQTMGGGQDNKRNAGPGFSFATRELTKAQALRDLTLTGAPPKSDANSKGFDPYNTSGTFDRKKHWERVGKR